MYGLTEDFGLCERCGKIKLKAKMLRFQGRLLCPECETKVRLYYYTLKDIYK